MKVINAFWLQIKSCRPKACSLNLVACSIVLITFISSSSTAQSVLKAEYFFDTDPGIGNATVITLSPTGGGIMFTSTISTTSLSPGFHHLAIRVKETGGLWGQFENRGFYITSSANDVPNIVAAEYFLDSDPGNGSGTAISVTPGATTNFTVSLPLTSLLPGFHFLAIRTKGLDGRWGVFEARGFYITNSATDAPNITASEYFFDSDPGNGNGTAISVTPGASANFTISLPTTSLLPGFHFLAIRTKGLDGKWGVFENRGFYITNSASDAPNIVAAEYFFDSDPGSGTGTTIPIASGASTNFTVSLPATSLLPGFHFLAMRTKGSDGRWGLFETRGFYISSSATNSADIVAAEYFIDGPDPGEGNAQAVAITTPGANINQVFNITINGVPSGSRNLNFRVKDINGIWSPVETSSFTVLACTPPSSPTVPDVSRCNSGTVTLNATAGASGPQVYRWYVDNSTNTILFTGTAFTTPSLSATTNYFVSVFDPSTLCESNRVAASAIVNILPKPTLNLTGSLTVCEGNSVMLIAPSGFTAYTWSNGLTTQQITVATSGTYSVIVSNGMCTSPSSDPFTFTINPKPVKPIINATGGGSLCGAGSVTLSAPAGFPTYSWSSGQSTQSILVNAVGNFTVTVADVNGCQSNASDVFSVITSAPSKPIITVSGNTTLCNGSTVVLAAPIGFSSYTWSTGVTSQQITVSIGGNYSVIVSSGTCASPVSDVVSIIDAVIPSKPTLTLTGSTTLCNGAFAVLTAPVGFSSYVWSNGELSKQIVVSTSGSFSVQTGNALNCLSIASDPMTTTLTGSSCGGTINSPTLTAASRCGVGTLNLVASGAGSGQVYRWYGTPSGGSLLFTGASFTTPALTTSTQFYASIFDSAIPAESSRTLTTATVVIIPTPTVSPGGTLSICAGGSTLLSGPVGFTNYLWSNGANTQQIIVTTNGNYSVQAGNGTCLSLPSNITTVSVVPLPAKPVITINGNTTFCETGSVTLTGPSGFQYVWSNGATSQAITITDSNVLSLVTKTTAGCTSVPSDPVVITRQVAPCQPNAMPVITSRPIAAKIEGIATADLTEFVSDPNNNLDYASLHFLSNTTAEGAPGSINGNYVATIDYKGLPFNGTDHITLSVCDLLGLCVQKILDIDVVGEIVVFNGVTPDGDGKNDFFYLQYLDVIPNAQKNKVNIFNRWGDVVFEMTDYNNLDRVFSGVGSSGNELPGGSYFYRIDLESSKPISGYITLKR